MQKIGIVFSIEWFHSETEKQKDFVPWKFEEFLYIHNSIEFGLMMIKCKLLSHTKQMANRGMAHQKNTVLFAMAAFCGAGMPGFFHQPIVAQLHVFRCLFCCSCCCYYHFYTSGSLFHMWYDHTINWNSMECFALQNKWSSSKQFPRLLNSLTNYD